jgi:hypothetical protein
MWPMGFGRSGNVNRRLQSIVLDEEYQDYTDEEIRVRDTLWCRSYVVILAGGALFWGLLGWLA